MITYRRSCISLLVILFYASCNIRPSGGGGGKFPNEKYFTSYYRGNNEMLYFFKPIKFKSEEASLEVDFTFISKGDTVLDSVTVNYSIITIKELKSTDLKALYFDSSKIAIGEQLFNELRGKNYKLRYTTKISKQLSRTLNDKTSIKCTLNEKDVIFYTASNYTKKSLLKFSSF
jgi:hypothetical protein